MAGKVQVSQVTLAITVTRTNDKRNGQEHISFKYNLLPATQQLLPSCGCFLARPPVLCFC